MPSTHPALTFSLAGTPSAIGEAKILLPLSVARDAVIDVRALLVHPMDTGFFRDAEGNPIPAYFVNAVTIAYGGEQVARFEWTSGISRDPFVRFPLRASREAPVQITWKDNKGGVYQQSVDLKFA
jgi:sulfur-oxidizing protein SoxZ